MAYIIESLDPPRTALVVVDMQYDFLAPGAPMETPAGRVIVPRLKEVLEFARRHGMLIVFTTHVHRHDGSDMGLYRELYPAIAARAGLIDGTPGTEIYADLAPRDDEIIIKKHRYSAFHGTDLDMVLRGRKVDTVVVAGVTSENCCHATARDAMSHDYRVIFLADATATHDYPDLGWGGVSEREVHRVTLTVLAYSTAHVMTAEHLFSLAGMPTTLRTPEGASGPQ